MKLAEHLRIGTPLVWVTTDESARVIDFIAERVQDRKVFRLDALEGLVVWSAEKNTWLKVLVGEDEDMGPTKEFADAVAHAMRQRGVFVLDHAHIQAEMLVNFFTAVQSLYRHAFFSDNDLKAPAQFVMLSVKDTMPPEIARLCAHITYPLPDAEALTSILEHIALSTPKVNFDENETKRIVRAGAGMSETEFISACLVSLNTKAAVDSEIVNSIKLENLKQSGLLEVRIPSMSLDDLGGLDLAKDLIRAVSWIWRNPEKAKANGIEPIRRILMIGVPGTGKSAICEATASTLGLELGKGGVSNALSKWVGESEQNMRKMFAQIKAMAPMLFWIDELGRDLSGGGSANDSGTTDRVHGEFLTGIQELPEDVFLMAAANRVDGLPPEMLRADRFDKILFVGFPTADERRDIFEIHLGQQSKNFPLDELATATPQFTGAEIKALIREVRFLTGAQQHREMTTQDLLDFIPNVRGRVWVNHRPNIVTMYQRALVEWDWASSGQRAEAESILALATQPTHTTTPQVAATYVPSGFEDAFGRSRRNKR